MKNKLYNMIIHLIMIQKKVYQKKNKLLIENKVWKKEYDNH